MTPEQRAAEVQQLRREHPSWSIWYAWHSSREGTYYASPPGHHGPAPVFSATAHGLRTGIRDREGL